MCLPAVSYGRNACQRLEETKLADPSASVCEPPESKRPSRRWSVSIDERRRLAVLGGWERPGVAGGPPSCRDITRIVAQLVSEDVDKDVLLPHPPRSAESTNAFHAFLARSAPFWQNVTLEALGSRSPPS
ncbi:testis-expressed protein 22 [Diceros bicornis minor]|uniref:testis-expressed protein 22 n=1 Tax=Diceros bicornis minor TaxID=77932 RepID=UPI0026EA1F62|nr:testis-expressed protein 22 [Diceros bicornis minor]